MRLSTVVTLLAVGVTAALLAAPAAAQTKNVTLSGFEEVPVVLTDATGEFRARIANDDSSIEYSLSYEGFSQVTQSHIHIAQPNVNGGIVLFLCTNLGNGPAGTQLCPQPPATITGVLHAADIVPQLTQDVSAGEFSVILAAIRRGLAYVNVHSVQSPTGVIRGQFSGGGHGHD
jgi:CHRD domain-containing protein